MKICPAHWQALRDAIEARGLSHLVAKDGRAAIENMVLELEQREAEAYFDPLMAAHNMIWSQGMNSHGLALMLPNEDGSEKCPVCEMARDWPQPPEGHRYKTNESYFIDGPADAVLEIAREKGLIHV